MTIKQFNYQDRPYEKAMQNGVETLTDTELLAIIIKSGTKNKTALDISRELLTKENQNIGLSFLTQYSLEELKRLKGIGNVKAIEIKAVIEIARRITFPKPLPKEKINTPAMLAHVFMNDLNCKSQEIIETAILDTKNRVIKVTKNSIGTINSNSVEIKDILREPLKIAASKIAIAHNHPSGDVNPSTEDIEFTKKLDSACKLFGIQLLDHIIIR